MTRISISQDAVSLAKGGNTVMQAVLAEIANRNLSVDVVRTGSRGLFWLEPMIEVETHSGRYAYGPVKADEVASLFDADFLNRETAHCLSQGLTDEIPYLKRQQRIIMKRLGKVEPQSLEDYRHHSGGLGLQQAQSMTPAQIVEMITNSGLRGRGGAAFPTGRKWQTVLNANADTKYIVCNADEGDSGTFADRMLMEGDPFCLFEGMAIAGKAVGAQKGYIYVRSEYPHAIAVLTSALKNATDWLAPFHIEVRKAAGSYVCGEETAMLESLEGKRGIVRTKPPLPALHGLFGQPTVVNNVITFASVPDILTMGATSWQKNGYGRSQGTMPFQLAGNIRYAGLVEVPFGLTLRTLLESFGGGSKTGRPIKAVQVGGPLGAYLPESQFDTPMDYEAFIAIQATLGHGGIVAFDDAADMAQLARYAFDFCAVESCGKCTPCRIGSTRGVELLDRLRQADSSNRPKQLDLLHELCDTMQYGSLCAMGSMTPNPVRSALSHFPEDFL